MRWQSLWLRSLAGLGLVLALAACGTKAKGREARALELGVRVLDWGTVLQNDAVERKLELRNRGTSPLRLGSRGTSARCKLDGVPDSMAPESTATITVRCQSDLLGPMEEVLSLVDAAQGDVLTSLEIKGTVEPLIGFDTAFVDLRPEFGATATAEVRVVGKRARDARPRVKSTGSELVTVSWLEEARASAPRFRVECRGDRVGMHAGSLALDTGIAETPSLVLSWGCRVLGTLEVEPATPYFNLRVSGERATTVTVQSRQPGFVVKAARIIDGPFTAALEKANPDGSYPITIRVQNARIPDDARSATGTLLVLSNDAREPKREVPLFGFGRVNKVEHPDSN